MKIRNVQTTAFAAAFGLGALTLGYSLPAAADPGDRIWSPVNDAASIENENTVRLTGGMTSVEAANLGMTVEAGTEVSFTPDLGAGVTCGGGAPRVFVQVAETVYNSFDGNPNQCGGPDGVVRFTIPTSGTITYAGVVFDNGQQGEVKISDLTIGEEKVNFLAVETKRLETIPAPVYTPPTCDELGKVEEPAQLAEGIEKYDIKPAVEGMVEVDVVLKDGYLKPDGWTPWIYPVAKKQGAECEVDESPSPSPSVTPSVTPSASASPSPSVAPTQPDTTPSADETIPVDNSDSLPVTGSPVVRAFLVGGLLVVIGLAGIALSRLRSRRFEA